MRLNFTLLCLLFSFSSLYAQIAINTTGSVPHPSAMLDVSATDKGMLIPGVSLTSVASAAPVTSPASGLLVWNTNASITGGNGIGFYYWDGTKWQSLLSDNTGWRLGGNSGTNPTLHFIGTTDNQPLLFKVNNFHAGKIDPAMNNLFLGIGAGFSISGASAKRNTFVGDSAGYNTSTNSDNSFFGYRAGRTATGFGNSIFGSQAGSKMTSGTSNSFFGHNAGRDNLSDGNSFFGDNAGAENTGVNNSIFGRSAGGNNLTGSQNSIFGSFANQSGTTGSRNCLFGTSAGSQNEGTKNNFMGYNAGLFSDTGHHNNFFGSFAGWQSDGNFNVYIGDSAGYLSGRSFNTLIGSRTNTGSTSGKSTVSNSTAIGYQAQVDADNSMVLGAINGVNGATADIKVGIGTTTPAYKLHVVNANAGGGGNIEGILIENTVVPPGNIGEAAISFKNYATGDSAWIIGLNESSHLSFALGTALNGPATKMYLNSSGNLGVGTTAPGAKLDVNGTAKIGVNGTVVNNIIRATLNVDLDSGLGMGAGSSHVTTVPVPNATLGATVFISPQNPLSLNTVVAYARVSAAGMVEIKLTNPGPGGVNHAAMDIYVTVIQ